jgi:hypothetical protein
MPKLYYLEKLSHVENMEAGLVSGKGLGFNALLVINERGCSPTMMEAREYYPAKRNTE